MAGWHQRLNAHEFELTPGVGDGQGGLVCCDSWGCKESDTTEQWTELKANLGVKCKCEKKKSLKFFFFFFYFQKSWTNRETPDLPSFLEKKQTNKLDFQGNGHQALKDSYPWEIGNKQGESLLSLQSLYLPSLQTKERAWVNDRDISGLIDGSNLTCLKWSNTPTKCIRRRTRQGSSLCYQREREIDIRLAQRDQQGNMPLTERLINHHSRESSQYAGSYWLDSKIKWKGTVRWVGCR